MPALDTRRAHRQALPAQTVVGDHTMLPAICQDRVVPTADLPQTPVAIRLTLPTLGATSQLPRFAAAQASTARLPRGWASPPQMTSGFARKRSMGNIKLPVGSVDSLWAFSGQPPTMQEPKYIKEHSNLAMKTHFEVRPSKRRFQEAKVRIKELDEGGCCASRNAAGIEAPGHDSVGTPFNSQHGTGAGVEYLQAVPARAALVGRRAGDDSTVSSGTSKLDPSVVQVLDEWSQPNQQEVVKSAAADSAADRILREQLNKKLQKSELGRLWSLLSCEKSIAMKAKPPGSGMDDAGALLQVDPKALLLRGQLLGCIPLCVFQAAELLRVEQLTLSEIRGLESVDLALFMVLADLKTLKVSGCPNLLSITHFASSTPKCAPTKLDFSQNPVLNSLPLSSIVAMGSVKELACQQCENLWSPPIEIARQGGMQTMDFLRAAFKTGKPNSVMSLFLLGDGESGKTSVFRALKSPNNIAERIHEDLRTVGIDTEEWRVNKKLTFRVCDLAGQAVYEMTHQFFLQQRALYVLVWRAFALADARRQLLQDRIRHWIDSLQLRVPGGRMMIVVTHVDSVQKPVLDCLCNLVKETVDVCLASIRKTSPTRVLSVFDGGESLRVNCLVGDGIAELREKLIAFTQTMPWYHEVLPSSFLMVREAVDDMVRKGIKYIPRSEWVALANSKGLYDALLVVGTRFLHETGEVRFFGRTESLADGAAKSEDDAVLHGFVYLSPQFMVAVMKGLIRHDRQALQEFFVDRGLKLMLRRTNRLNATGRMHEDLVPFLWPTSQESEEYWKWVRAKGDREADLWRLDVVKCPSDLERAQELLAGFDLMVCKAGQGEYIVPGVLPASKKHIAADAFASNLELPFCITSTYDALPAGAFQRIVVRVAGRTDWNDFSSEDAVFYLQGNIATLTCNRVSTAQGQVLERELTELRWRSSNRKLLSIIKEGVERIEQFFPGLPQLSLNTDIPASARDPVQVLILAANEEAAVFIEGAIKTASKLDLVIELQRQDMDLAAMRLVRTLVVCLSADFALSRERVAQVEAHLKAGQTRVILIFMHGFDPRKASLWGVAKLKDFEHQAIDLRVCSMTRKQLEVRAYKEIDTEQQEKLKWTMSVGEQPKELTKQERQDIVKRTLQYLQNELERQAVAAADEVRRSLLPHLKRLLSSWRIQAPQQRYATSTLEVDNVMCSGCSHKFERAACQRILDQCGSLEDCSQGAIIVCPQCHAEHKVLELLESPEVQQCPICVKRPNAASVGLFTARECRLCMAESLTERSYTMPCSVCGEQVSLFDVFPPEVYASLSCAGTGKAGTDGELTLISTVLKQIEAEANVLVWVAVARRGGSCKRGTDAESRRALTLAQILIVFLSDDYASSPECTQVVKDAVRQGKLIVPMLLPGLTRDPSRQPPPAHGKTRSIDVEEYWRHMAEFREAQLDRKDLLDWRLLSQLSPHIIPEASHMQEPKVQPNEGSKLENLVSETVALVASRLHRVVKMDVFSDLSLFGVHLSYFRVFIDQCSIAKIGRKTTDQVMREFVFPRTRASKLSLCEQLLMSDSEACFVGTTAKVFVSHAWKYVFVDVVDAIERQFKGQGDPVVWFDVFSVSQHRSESRAFEWWTSTFLNAIGSMGHVVMVLQPWHAQQLSLVRGVSSSCTPARQRRAASASP